jgi:hypothetical protein
MDFQRIGLTFQRTFLATPAVNGISVGIREPQVIHIQGLVKE